MSSMPLTRKVSITLHEIAYPALLRLAEEDTEANVNRAVRQLIYRELIQREFLTPELFASLYGQEVA